MTSEFLTSVFQEIKALRLRETCESKLKLYSKYKGVSKSQDKKRAGHGAKAKPGMSYSRRFHIKNVSSDGSSDEDENGSSERSLQVSLKSEEPTSMIKLASRRRIATSESDSQDEYETNPSTTPSSNGAFPQLTCDLVTSDSPTFEVVLDVKMMPSQCLHATPCHNVAMFFETYFAAIELTSMTVILLVSLQI